jgi:hypothetical protein
MLILIVVLTVIVVPTVVLLAIGKVGDEARARKRVESSDTGELPEILRRPLRAGRAA